MKMRPKQLTLEDYCAFHRNPQDPDVLTVSQLRQVISMHGFTRLHNRPKGELVDAALSIGALMSPTRSTLQQSISSCTPLTIDEVKDDLAKLEWQECPVRSIKTLKSAAGDSIAEEDDIHRISGSSNLNPGCSEPLITGSSPVKAKRSRSRSRSKKRKRTELKTVIDASPAAAAASTIDVLAEVAATASEFFADYAAAAGDFADGAAPRCSSRRSVS